MAGVGCLHRWLRIRHLGAHSPVGQLERKGDCGRATVKEGHELIVSGPYRVTRHPIYAGLLLACLGTALVEGEWRCIAGLVLIAAAFAKKIRSEERMMMEAFPRDYPRYRQRVKTLIPGVF